MTMTTQAPAYPPEHYGCPPWCRVNDGGSGPNHDIANGLPGRPDFDGHQHWTSVTAGPLTVRLAAVDGGNLNIAVGIAEADQWTGFTLDEADQLAGEINRLAKSVHDRGCPSWCEEDDRHSAALDGHYASMTMEYASAPRDEAGVAGFYAIALSQVEPAPRIILCGGEGMMCDVIELTVAAAAHAAAAIGELAAAAREGRAADLGAPADTKTADGCPPWCEVGDHHCPPDCARHRRADCDRAHFAMASVPYAAARQRIPKGVLLSDPEATEMPGSPYCVDLCQENDAPADIRLFSENDDFVEDGGAGTSYSTTTGVTVFTIDEADQLAHAILRLVAAAREGRPAVKAAGVAS
jgi:hypothetical protein